MYKLSKISIAAQIKKTSDYMQGKIGKQLELVNTKGIPLMGGRKYSGK